MVGIIAESFATEWARDSVSRVLCDETGGKRERGSSTPNSREAAATEWRKSEKMFTFADGTGVLNETNGRPKGRY